MRDDARNILKASALFVLLVCSFFILRSDAVRPHLTAEALNALVESVGPWGPIVFVGIFTIFASLPFPGSLFVIAGGAIFGFWVGLGLSFISVLLSATTAFFLARTLGRGFARKIAGSTLRRYDDRLSTNGFRTVLYLRMFVPFAIVNYASGLSSVRWRDYLLATAIGTIPALLFMLFFVDSVRDVILTHGIVSWELLRALMRWDVLIAGTLMVACFAIPHIVQWRSARKRSRKERRTK